MKHPATIANELIRVGYFDALPTDLAPDPNEGIYWRINGVGNIEAVTRTGGVETATNTGIAPANTYKHFEIEIIFSAVTFTIDDVVVATHSTNIPGGNMLLANFAGEAAAIAGITDVLDIDSIKLRGVRL